MTVAMKNILLLTFVLLIFGTVFAQDSKNDSLIALSREVTGNDLAIAYFDLSGQLLDSLPDSALYFANQAELILTKSDPDGMLPPLFKL